MLTHRQITQELFNLRLPALQFSPRKHSMGMNIAANPAAIAAFGMEVVMLEPHTLASSLSFGLGMIRPPLIVPKVRILRLGSHAELTYR